MTLREYITTLPDTFPARVFQQSKKKEWQTKKQEIKSILHNSHDNLAKYKTEKIQRLTAPSCMLPPLS